MSTTPIRPIDQVPIYMGNERLVAWAFIVNVASIFTLLLLDALGAFR